ncbi:MAG TPA: hypothetical protein VIK29_08015, partial [Paludibacter sp.]
KNKLPFSFTTHKNGLIMQTLQHENEYITVVINKSTKDETVALQMNTKLKPHVIFSEKGGSISKNIISIPKEGTLVIKWQN